MKAGTAGLLLMMVSGTLFAGSVKEHYIIGWIEPVQLSPENFVVMAKVDTGADHSSLDAQDIEIYEHGGKDWVRFTIRNNDDDKLVLQRPLLRYAHIKRKKSEPLKRPVVNLTLCLGKRQYEAPVNLAQRKNFKYRMLIGRSFLHGRYLVDSGEKELTTPACQ